MEAEMEDNMIGNRPNPHPLPLPLPYTTLQGQNNSGKKTKTASIKAENIANMMAQLGNVSQNGIGFWVGRSPAGIQSSSFNSTEDDPTAFGCLVAHKLRGLSARSAICAQTDIITVLQKYVLAELEED